MHRSPHCAAEQERGHRAPTSAPPATMFAIASALWPAHCPTSSASAAALPRRAGHVGGIADDGVDGASGAAGRSRPSRGSEAQATPWLPSSRCQMQCEGLPVCRPRTCQGAGPPGPGRRPLLSSRCPTVHGPRLYALRARQCRDGGSVGPCWQAMSDSHSDDKQVVQRAGLRSLTPRPGRCKRRLGSSGLPLCLPRLRLLRGRLSQDSLGPRVQRRRLRPPRPPLLDPWRAVL